MGLFGAVICILLAIAMLVVICLLAIKVRKDWPSKNFDERQKIAQSHGCKVSFWLGLIYYVAVTVYLVPLEVGEEPGFSPFLLLYFGMMGQIMVLHIHGLLTHSELPLSGKPVATIVGYIISGCIHLVGMKMNWRRYPGLALRGEGTIQWVFLVSSMTFFLLAGAHGISLLWKEKEEEV